MVLYLMSKKDRQFSMFGLYILATAYVFFSLKAQNNCHDTNKKSSQQAEWDLNKIEKTFNGTFMG